MPEKALRLKNKESEFKFELKWAGNTFYNLAATHRNYFSTYLVLQADRLCLGFWYLQ